MKLPELLRAGLVGLTLTSDLPPANAQGWTTEIQHAKTSEFSIPALAGSELVKEFKEVIANPNLYKSKLIFGNDFPESGIPYGYKDVCSRIGAYLDHICKVIEKSKFEILTLHESTYSVLEAVNRFANKSKSPISDKDLFNIDEYWDHLVYRNAGDCEDIARLKNILLIYKHFPPETLNIALVEHLRNDGQVEGHLVLLVTLEQGNKKVTFVLDNLKEKPILMRNAKHLRFIAALSPDRKSWKEISVGEN